MLHVAYHLVDDPDRERTIAPYYILSTAPRTAVGGAEIELTFASLADPDVRERLHVTEDVATINERWAAAVQEWPQPECEEEAA